MDVALTDIAEGKNVGFDQLEEETSRITLEVAELSRFIRLNYSAFMKVFFPDRYFQLILCPLDDRYCLDFEKTRQAYILYAQESIHDPIASKAILQAQL